MNIKRSAALTGCAVVLLAGTSLATGTTAGAEEVTCSTPTLTSVPVRLADQGLWSYHYQVSWCVEEGLITNITHNVTHEEDGSTCVWVANAEESHKRVLDGSGAWNAFNMAEFSCKNPDGQDGSVNPWGVITVWPNGASSVLRKGVGDVIEE
ncbi:hypothetical protein ACWGE0_12025 [Lentzea sp. NPDC054927]